MIFHIFTHTIAHISQFIIKHYSLKIKITYIAKWTNQGVILLGSLGKREELRIFLRAQYNITTLYNPIPPPP